LNDHGTPVRIQRIRRTRAYEEIVRQLQALIAEGHLKPGDRLMTERDLAEQFGVSRVTVRQALSVLQAMGLIESRIGNGTYARRSEAAVVTVLAPVLNPSHSGLLEQLELRRLIEPEVARLAAERATPAQTQDMAHFIELQEQMLSAGRPFVDEDSAFHLAIARSAGNDLVFRMMASIHDLLRDTREKSLNTREGMIHSLAGHRQILEAILRQDPKAAHRATLRHIREVEAGILRSHHPTAHSDESQNDNP
jgi:GntR family transcriptional regulator, transcriptional repressor for pyruvate dehydrogenase complex